MMLRFVFLIHSLINGSSDVLHKFILHFILDIKFNMRVVHFSQKRKVFHFNWNFVMDKFKITFWPIFVNVFDHYSSIINTNYEYLVTIFLIQFTFWPLLHLTTTDRVDVIPKADFIFFFFYFIRWNLIIICNGFIADVNGYVFDCSIEQRIRRRRISRHRMKLICYVNEQC